MQINKPFFLDSIKNAANPWSTFWEESLYLDGISDKIGFKKYIYDAELNGLKVEPEIPMTARKWAINSLKISLFLLGLPALIMLIGKAIHRSFHSYNIADNKKDDNKPVIHANSPPQTETPVVASSLAPPTPAPAFAKDGSLLGMIKSSKANDLKPEEMKHNIRGLYLTNNSKKTFGQFFNDAPLFLISWLARLMPDRDDYSWDENTTLATYQACLRTVIESDHPEKLERILAFIRGDEIGIDRHPLDDIRKCCYFKMECERLSEEDQAKLKSLMSAEELKVLSLPIIIDVIEYKPHLWEERTSKRFDQLTQEEIDSMRPEWVLDLALDFGGWILKGDAIIEISLKVKEGALQLASKIFSWQTHYNKTRDIQARIRMLDDSKTVELKYLRLCQAVANTEELHAFHEYCIKNDSFPYGRGAHLQKVKWFRESQAQG